MVIAGTYLNQLNARFTGGISMSKKTRGILTGVKCWFALLGDWDSELSPQDERMGTPNPAAAPMHSAPTTRQAVRPTFASAKSSNAVVSAR